MSEKKTSLYLSSLFKWRIHRIAIPEELNSRRAYLNLILSIQSNAFFEKFTSLFEQCLTFHHLCICVICHFSTDWILQFIKFTKSILVLYSLISPNLVTIFLVPIYAIKGTWMVFKTTIIDELFRWNRDFWSFFPVVIPT